MCSGWDEFPGRLPWADEFEPFGLWDPGVKAPWAGWPMDVGECMTLAEATVPNCDPDDKQRMVAASYGEVSRPLAEFCPAPWAAAGGNSSLTVGASVLRCTAYFGAVVHLKFG